MAIVYSYEQATQPAFGDLLLGTDVSASGKPTKSFSIQSIVDLVQTGVPGGGTVTSINTNATNYITMSGGPITTTGTLTASLSATGVPSTTTFLRGDNVWATPAAAANTTYVISAVQSGLNNNIRLTGSDTSQTIVSLIAGPNILLTNNGSSGITIGVTGLPEGTVTSVTADGGLYIVSGSATVNPVLAVDLTGLNNYIKIGQSQTTAISDDFIAFNQSSSTNVKTTTLGAITPAALTLVKDYIDAGDVGDIRNNTDTFTDVANVDQVVSLSSTEYTALPTKNANTLYIVVTPAVEYTTTLAFTNNISGTEYTITGDQAGATRTGIAGASYSYNSNVVPNSGFYFSSGPSITNAVGLFSANETVYTILSGTVSAVAQPTITATLAVSTAGVSGTQFTLGGDLAGATQSGPAPLTYAFNTTITPSAGYAFTSGPTITNATGTINGSQTVVTSISGVLEQVAPAAVVVTAQVNESFTGAGAAQGYTTVTPGSFSGNSPLAYSFNVDALTNSGYYFSSGPTITGDLSGSATSSKNAVINVSGVVEAIDNVAIVDLIVSNTISGPAAGYVIGGNLTGAQLSGTTPFSYAFNTTVTLNPGYEWVSGTAPTINNAAGVTSVIGTQSVTTTISGAQVVATVSNVTATLNVTYNISGPAVWSPSGYLTGETDSGLPPFDYDFTGSTPSVTVPAGYGFSVAPSASGNLTGTISANTTVPITVTATVVAVQQTGTVAVAFVNNMSYNGGAAGSGVAYVTTSLVPAASITGNIGDPYSFTHSVSANSGYVIETENWSPSATLSGTITNTGTTTISQSLTGNVIDDITGFLSTTASTFNGVCSLLMTQQYYHNGSGELPTEFDNVFSDIAGTQPLPAGYYGMATGSGSFYGYFRIISSSSGEVALTGVC